MKRFLAVLVVLVMSIHATAIAEHIIFTRNDYEEDKYYTWNYSIAKFNDNLYVFTKLNDHGSISWGYTIHENIMEPLSLFEYNVKFDKPYNIFTSDNHIWSYNFSDDLLHINEIAFDNDGTASFKEISSLDYINEFGESFYPIVPIICGNYFICADWSQGEYARLDVFDMDIERADTYEVDDDHYMMNVVGICPYQDDAALVISAEYEGEIGVNIYSFYPEEGNFEKLVFIPTDDPMGFIGPAYDKTGNKFYYVVLETLYSITDFNLSTAVGLPDFTGQCFGSVESQAFVTTDGYYIISDGTTLCACSTDPSAKPEQETPSISISGVDSYEFVSDACYAYMRANQDANVVYSTKSLTGDSIAASIIAQSDAFDLYILNLSKSDYWALYDKEFLVPIGSEKITGFVERMYPEMKNLVMLNRDVVAMPIYYNASCMSYNPTVFAELGLTEEDVPTTWMEFLLLLQRMPELIKGTDYSVFDASFVDSAERHNIGYKIIQSFCTHFLYDDVADPAFDNELMHVLLAEYEKIDFHNMGLSESSDDRLEGNDVLTVFCTELEADVGRRSSDSFTPMPLALDEGMEPVVDGDLTVMVLNPYSKNKETAISFLEMLADYVPATTLAGISADWADGVKIEGADDYLAEANEEIAMLQSEIDSAKDDNEKAQYQELLNSAYEQRDWILYRFYWEVSPDRLAEYQAYADHVRLNRYFGMDVSAELFPAVQMYLDGASDMDTMLNTLDKKMNIMLGEQ